jgi:hypothetical protein
MIAPVQRRPMSSLARWNRAQSSGGCVVDVRVMVLLLKHTRGAAESQAAI